MPDKEKIEEENNAAPTKRNLRSKIWEHVTENDLVNVPPRVYNKFPNFKGTDEAAHRLLELDQFKQAKVVKINLDKPQEPVRLETLRAGKEILLPTPRLKDGLFVHVKLDPDTSEEQIKSIATRNGLGLHGVPLGLDTVVKVDLVVLGAVCVDRLGHRIGKGEGFADLEYAVMMKIGAIDSSTTIVTTVHDCQVVDDLPDEMFEKYDVPVDVIVTPTRTIIVNERLPRPEGIFWDLLTPRRVESMQVLQELRRRDEVAGIEVTLKPEDPSEERRRSERRRPRRNKSGKRVSSKRPLAEAEFSANDENATKGHTRETTSSRLPRRRRLRERKSTEGDNRDDSSKRENDTKENRNGSGGREHRGEKPRKRKSLRARVRSNIDFSLKLTNIKSDVRVRHLKNALLERGVRASVITWHGQQGYCYLHFVKLRNKEDSAEPDQPIQVDSIVANLQKLKLGKSAEDEPEDNADEYIVVEPAKPATRIEITDVTTV